MKPITSIDEFKIKFFPKAQEKELLRKDPREYGRYMARKSTEKLRRLIKEMTEQR